MAQTLSCFLRFKVGTSENYGFLGERLFWSLFLVFGLISVTCTHIDPAHLQHTPTYTHTCILLSREIWRLSFLALLRGFVLILTHRFRRHLFILLCREIKRLATMLFASLSSLSYLWKGFFFFAHAVSFAYSHTRTLSDTFILEPWETFAPQLVVGFAHFFLAPYSYSGNNSVTDGIVTRNC